MLEGVIDDPPGSRCRVYLVVPLCIGSREGIDLGLPFRRLGIETAQALRQSR